MFGKTFLSGQAVGISIVIIAAISLGLRLLDHGPIKQVVKLAGESVVVEIAATPETRAQGLSGRDRLAPGTGMLFIFPEPGRVGFWMKDMKFPIDIIWMENGHVVDLALDVPTDSVQLYYPRVPASFVLEVPAGFSRDHPLAIGDAVDIR